jgi:hypothetical protein
MASLRSLAIGVLRRHGHRDIAAALRRNARDPSPNPSWPSQARETDKPDLAEALPVVIPGHPESLMPASVRDGLRQALPPDWRWWRCAESPRGAILGGIQPVDSL